MQTPARSASIARASACLSPLPRSIGIWPMPLRIGASPRTFQRSDFARARIWRRLRAAIPTMIGSQWESWLPRISSGPLSGIASRPSTCSRPQAATGRLMVIATP